jgi:hypothetical protein
MAVFSIRVRKRDTPTHAPKIDVASEYFLVCTVANTSSQVEPSYTLSPIVLTQMKASNNISRRETSPSSIVEIAGHPNFQSTHHQHQRQTVQIAPKPSPWTDGETIKTLINNTTHSVHPSVGSYIPSTMTQASTVAPAAGSTTTTTAAPPSRPFKTVWYLGGNHAAKLLTSVDGDLDPDVLAKLASVPSAIGELALSVESLVSDDFTVGGFENDLLAKIAANTLDAKKKAVATIAPKKVPENPPKPATTAATPTPPSPPPSEESRISDAFEPESSPVTFTGSVPNPLLENYDPVPNPLARITPPGSPTPVAEATSGNKRKESPTGDEHLNINKAMRTTTDESSMIQAR